MKHDYHLNINLLLLYLDAVSSKQGQGAGAGPDQRCAWSPGGGGAASPWGGAERRRAGGAVPPHPEGPLEPCLDEPDADALPPGAHADAHSGRAVGGERPGEVQTAGCGGRTVDVEELTITETNHLFCLSDQPAGDCWKVHCLCFFFL